MKMISFIVIAAIFLGISIAHAQSMPPMPNPSTVDSGRVPETMNDIKKIKKVTCKVMTLMGQEDSYYEKPIYHIYTEGEGDVSRIILLDNGGGVVVHFQETNNFSLFKNNRPYKLYFVGIPCTISVIGVLKKK